MNIKAIFFGVLCYLSLLLIWFFVAPQFEHRLVHTESLVMSAIYLFLPFISGYISALMAKQKRILNGLISSIIIALLSAIAWLVLDIFSMLMLLNLFSIIILGTLGAVTSQWLSSFYKKTAK
jgi:putative membrane protein (TIGR04086 family)